MSYVTDIVAYAEGKEYVTIEMILRDLYGIERSTVSWGEFQSARCKMENYVCKAKRQGWLVFDHTENGGNGYPVSAWRVPQ